MFAQYCRAICIIALISLGAIPAVSAADQTRIFIDDLGRQVTVPAHPKRIVSMHDLDITIPLIELGVAPVASHGRQRLDGSRFLRSGEILTGTDFDNSGMAFIGATNADIEAVAAAKPDLIITEPGRNLSVEQLEKIAPTVSINNRSGGAPRIYKQIAQLTGTEDQLAILDRRYRAQIAELRRTIDTAQISVAVFQAQNGKIGIYHTYRSLGRVLRDAGFKFPPIIDALPEDGRMEISAERLPEIDADFIFDPYRSDSGGLPKDEIAEMEKLIPGYCQFLKACREGRYILIPREEAISNSYAALSLMVSTVQSHIAGRPLPSTAQ